MDAAGAHMVGDPHESKQRKAQEMGSTVLDCFAKLASENDVVRLDGGTTLLRYLYYQNLDLDNNREVKYAVTRLVRSLGSSRSFARKGFYTTMTVFLTMHPETPVDKILSIMDAELHPMSSNPKSENADIYMGRILVCGALIRSKLILSATAEVQRQIIENLINSGKKRSYLTFVSVTFFIEFLNLLEVQTFKKTFWPFIEQEFGKAWTEQTLDSLYVLLVLRDKFPTLINQKFLKKHLGVDDVICRQNMEDIVRVLTDLPRIASSRHPIFKLFTEKLSSSKLVTDFWLQIDQRFAKPSKSDERIALEILKLLLPNITDKAVLPHLVSPNFVQHMLKKFYNYKRTNNDGIVVLFREFLNLLASITSGKDVQTKTQVSVLKKLILHPGDLMIEKKTGTKVIQSITTNLNLEGVKKLSKLYRGIIENKTPKEKQNLKMESWTNAERTYMAQLLTKLMGHPETMADQDWRLEQLIFLFGYGLCEMPNVGVELAPQFKESFYRALDHKLPKLTDLRSILSRLVHHLNEELTSESIKLKTPLSDAASEAWKKVMDLIKILEKDTKNLQAVPIFHTMILHMSLQLFSDADMAITSINELQSCYDRFAKKPKKQKKSPGMEKNKEPEWIEVVVDLLLSLLSRNSHLLRSLVGCVFPHICPHLTTATVYQILAVLDVNNEDNPLVVDNSANNDTEYSETNTDSDSDSDKEESEEEAEEECSSDASESNSDDESQDEDDTVNDRLRVAVRQALGDASMQTDDEDIDVDQIAEEEGKRLDESLAAAFRILRENRQSRSKKQEKSAQALTHFRVRVSDLLDAYLESGPPMVDAINMLVPLFALLEYCIKTPHQEPLEIRIRSCLKKLSGVKKFKHTEGVDDDLLKTVLKALIEKGERSASVCQEMGDKLAECCTFFVRCVQQAGLSSQPVIDIYVENMKAFFKKRDCVLPSMLFKSVLQLYWEGNWYLAPMLVDFAFDDTIRSFRRGQALEFLTTFYRNNRLIRSDIEHKNTRLDMEKRLCDKTINMFKELCKAHSSGENQSAADVSNNVGKEIKQKSICHLLVLLHTVHPQHMPEAWNWPEIAKLLSEYRSNVTLAKDAKSAYNKLASQIGATINTSAKKSKSELALKVNGQAVKGEANQTGATESVEANGDEEVSNAAKKSAKKKKGKRKEKQLLKKEARELRLKSMSEGFQSFEFSSVILPNGVDEKLQNGDSEQTRHGEKSGRSVTQKRVLNETEGVSNKPKRRKSAEAV